MLLNFAINEIFVSLPEEICLILITLAFLRKFNCISLERAAVLPATFTILIPSIASNLLRYIFKPETDIIFPVFAILYIASFIFFYRIRSLKGVLKAVAGCTFGMILNIILELGNMGLLMVGTGLNVEEMNSDILLNIITAIPMRVIEIFLFMLLVYRNSKGRRPSIIKIIKDSNLALLMTSFVLTFFTGYTFVFCKLLILDRLIAVLQVSGMAKIMMLIGIIITPVISMSALFAIIYALKLKEIERKIHSRETLKTFANMVKKYANEGKYDKMNTVLSDIKNL